MPLAKPKTAWDGEVVLDSQIPQEAASIPGRHSASPTPEVRAGCLAPLQTGDQASPHLPAPHPNWGPLLSDTMQVITATV